MARSFGLTVAYYAAILVLLIPALAAFTGNPFISYASSPSMEPTIGVLDGFLVNPFASYLGAGDIILFESVLRGERAVHRIVDGDGQGWYTKGDANPTVDQLVGEPTITPDRILGRVVTRADGTPVVIPNFGIPFVAAKGEVRKLEAWVGGEDALRALFFAVIAVVLGIAALLPGRPASRVRSPRAALFARRWQRRAFPKGIQGRHLALGLLLLLAATSYTAASMGEETLYTSLVVVEDQSGPPDRSASPGQAAPRLLETGSVGLFPTYVILEPVTPGLRVSPEVHRVGVGERVQIGYEEIAGPTIGLQQDELRVYRYPALLPAETTRALHDWRPGSPYAAITAALSLAGYAWYLALGIGNLRIARWLGVDD